MILLIDQQLPARLARWFEERGFAAIHVRDIGMQGAPDADIWNYALAWPELGAWLESDEPIVEV